MGAIEELAARAWRDIASDLDGIDYGQSEKVIAAAIREALREPLAALDRGTETLPDDALGKVHECREATRATLAKWSDS